MRGLIEGPVLTRNDEIAWALRTNAPILETQVNSFLSQHMWMDEHGTPKRSEFLNVLRKKYFEGSRQMADYFNPVKDQQKMGALSPYDSLMQQVAAEFGMDWVMLTAVAAQESKFDSEVVSWAGAVGIMQVIPKYSEQTADSLLIPEINIREGARILSEHIQHYSYMDSLESWSFALASYNAGAGHIADARRIAMDHNKDPNKWADVAPSLLKKMEPKYYEQTRHGYARGIETVQYVQNILNRYNTYKAIIVLSQESRPEPKGILGFNNLKIAG
jgi:membrane-bound lytic murein transglycosylase F